MREMFRKHEVRHPAIISRSVFVPQVEANTADGNLVDLLRVYIHIDWYPGVDLRIKLGSALMNASRDPRSRAGLMDLGSWALDPWMHSSTRNLAYRNGIGGPTGQLLQGEPDRAV